MGGGIPGLIIVLVLVVLAVVAMLAIVPWARRQKAHVDHVAGPDVETLRYQVPEGQDPVAVQTALKTAGFDAVPDPNDSYGGVVLVACPRGVAAQREEVRTIIREKALLNVTDDAPAHVRTVRFADE